MCRTVEEDDQMVMAAEAAGVLLQVAHMIMMRFDPGQAK